VEGGSSVLTDDHLAVQHRVVALEACGRLGQLGNQSVAFEPGRLRRLTLPSATVATMRKPSHFTSAAQPSPDTTLPLLASIGAREGGTGRSEVKVYRRPVSDSGRQT
jgi:hypothetical protein